MPEVAIGIDLGTSNSAVAIVRAGQIEVLPNAFGELIMASAVSFREDGNILVGNEAKANAIRQPACTITSAKRLIGRYFFSEEVKKAQAICAYKIVEGPEHSVRVNSISPGNIATGILIKALGMKDASKADAMADKLKPAFATVQPIPRAGIPEDIAECACWLASDRSTFVNGEDIVVDGGQIRGRMFTPHQAAVRQTRSNLGLGG